MGAPASEAFQLSASARMPGWCPGQVVLTDALGHICFRHGDVAASVRVITVLLCDLISRSYTVPFSPASSSTLISMPVQVAISISPEQAALQHGDLAPFDQLNTANRRDSNLLPVSRALHQRPEVTGLPLAVNAAIRRI